MSDVPKKKKMLEYLLETRRQMIKMLVLVKWAKVSKEVEQYIVHPPLSVRLISGCRSFPPWTAELLQQRHNVITTRSAYTDICEVRVPPLTSYDRLRNPDLRTAIDVLSNGNFPTFPNQLTVY
jgi:hypothetical protein